MLATLVDDPFHRPGWVYEEKYDGYRILAYKEGRGVTLYSRNANDRTESFADVAAAIKGLPDRTLSSTGRSSRSTPARLPLPAPPAGRGSFRLRRLRLSLPRRQGPSPRASSRPSAAARGGDRKGRTGCSLRGDWAPTGSRPTRRRGGKGFEGLVAKNASAPYIEGRSTKWLKVKVKQQEEFVIGGYTRARGAHARTSARS